MVMPAAAYQSCARARKRCGGFLLLVGQDLGVGQPGVVVQGGVQVAVAEHRAAVLAGAGGGGPVALPCARPGGAPAAAVRDVAELLDIDVDQLAGPVALVAADRDAVARSRCASGGQR